MHMDALSVERSLKTTTTSVFELQFHPSNFKNNARTWVSNSHPWSNDHPQLRASERNERLGENDVANQVCVRVFHL